MTPGAGGVRGGGACSCTPVAPRAGRSIAVTKPAGHERRAAAAFFPATQSFVGTDRPVFAYDGEGPRRPVRLEAFALETTPVTNRRFAGFVAATGYRTEAEMYGSSAVFSGLLAPTRPQSRTISAWEEVAEASWFAPEGPGSSIAGREDHPVVHLSWHDAQAFAVWCGGRLPTEAEWEHAARGGLPDPRFPWGDDEPDDQTVYANIWQGRFPDINILTDGYLGTSPVQTFPANGAGLHDMAGNVWEWSADAFLIAGSTPEIRQCNIAAIAAGQRLLKGGSFLCHRSSCYRYRIAARMGLSSGSSAGNAGLRVAYSG
jgi:formylglycine-generating enzyme required for sulfatase activity